LRAHYMIESTVDSQLSFGEVATGEDFSWVQHKGSYILYREDFGRDGVGDGAVCDTASLIMASHRLQVRRTMVGREAGRQACSRRRNLGGGMCHRGLRARRVCRVRRLHCTTVGTCRQDQNNVEFFFQSPRFQLHEHDWRLWTIPTESVGFSAMEYVFLIGSADQAACHRPGDSFQKP
jgi:hypothetical protein